MNTTRTHLEWEEGELVDAAMSMSGNASSNAADASGSAESSFCSATPGTP